MWVFAWVAADICSSTSWMETIENTSSKDWCLQSRHIMIKNYLLECCRGIKLVSAKVEEMTGVGEHLSI